MTGEEKRKILSEAVLIIPSLNPDQLFVDTVCAMSAEGFSRILVVNDGSAPENLWAFEAAEQKTGCTVIGYDVNQGKGHALKYAFEYVLENYQGAYGVVTCDGDGQHSPEDCVNVALRLHDCGNKIIFGARDFTKENVPKRNRFGNVVTRTIFNLLYNLKIDDAQTGLRGIPYSALPLMLTVEGERFEYESNVLIAIADEHIPYVNLPISTIYIEGNRRSHFRVIRDSYRVYKPVILYLLSALSSAVIDLGIFTALMAVLNLSDHDKNVLIATITARIISSLYNYAVNRNAVFKSKEPGRKTVVRYYILAACQMLISYKGVSLLTAALGITGVVTALIKFAVDAVLFFFSFRIQRKWVFAK